MNIAKLHPVERQSLPMPADLDSLETWFDQRLGEKLAEREAAKIPSLAIILDSSVDRSSTLERPHGC